MTKTFDYTARDRTGALRKGEVEADTQEAVSQRLASQDLIPTSITPRSTAKISANKEINIPGLSGRIKMTEVATATRQLATMVDSGIPLVQSVRVLGEQTDNKALAKILISVGADIEVGTPFSAACAKHPKVFNKLFIAMVQSGEKTGELNQVLSELAASLEKQAKLRRAIKSAMTYPIVVMCVMGAIFLAMLVFIVPVFTKLFKQLHASLPMPTQVVIKVSNVVISPWAIVVLGVIIGVVVIVRRWISTESGRLKWDTAKLHIPIFGNLISKLALARMTTTFASLLHAGVPILSALDTVSDTVGNQVMANAVLEAKEEVKGGKNLADALGSHPVFPHLLIEMISVGETSGSMDTMLSKVGEFYQAEADIVVGNLTSILEPILTVMMGLVVGTMVISMYLPMFTYIQHVPSG